MLVSVPTNTPKNPMFAYFPHRLVLGLLLLNTIQVVASTPTVAQAPQTELKAGASIVSEEVTVKPPLLMAQQSPRPRRIQFARGANSATIENAVVRGTRDTYLLNAKAGQKMTVSITSLENNAVFDIIAPNQRAIKQESTSGSFTLPRTGDYRVIVGGTRGNATYKLKVSIK